MTLFSPVTNVFLLIGHGCRPRALRLLLFDWRYFVERGKEIRAWGALVIEYVAPCGGKPIVTSTALARFLDPSALDPPTSFEPVQQRVERRYVKLQNAVRALLDQLRDFVAVPRTFFDEREDQHLGAASF